MPLYAFRCTACGPFDLQLEAGTAGSARECPECGTSARRSWGVPALKATSAAAQASAVDERSRHAPERVSGPGHGHDHHGHSHGGHKHVHSSPGRPWQVSH